MPLPAPFRRLLTEIARSLRGSPVMRGSRGAGQRWEDLAEKHLRRSGYRIVARNFRAGPGEIDFIATEGPILCFVEVKGRAGPGSGLPEAAVTPEKQRRIRRAAEAWIARSRGLPRPCRFDVVAILEREGGLPSIRLFRGAFETPPASHILPRRR